MADNFEKYSWLNKLYFEKLLHRDNGITVTNIALEAASGKGEHFSSDMIRAKVEYSINGNSLINNTSLIIKSVTVSDPQMEKLLRSMGIFEKEIIIYQQILPEVEKLLNSVGDLTKLSPKCYDSNLEKSYLVFEDLCSLNYCNVDKKVGLDIDLYKAALVKLAKWHAATAVLLIEKPSLFNLYYEPPLQKSTLNDLAINMINSLSDVLKKFDGFAEISEKVQRCSSQTIVKSAAATKRNENELNVLCHGDVWANNIMFIKDELGHPNDAILFDYQGCYWGPVILDVINIFYTSSHAELREKDWSDLTEFYYTELASMLTKLKYPETIPTLEEIQLQRRNRGFASLPMSFVSLALRNMEPYDDMAITKLIRNEDEDKQFRLKLLSNPKIRNNLEYLVRYFDSYGYFN